MTMTTPSDTSASAEAETISIYEAIGGRAALIAAVDGFFGRLLADPVLGPFFPVVPETGTAGTS
jgi:truncated hemoglobin YjbI